MDPCLHSSTVYSIYSVRSGDEVWQIRILGRERAFLPASEHQQLIKRLSNQREIASGAVSEREEYPLNVISHAHQSMRPEEINTPLTRMHRDIRYSTIWATLQQRTWQLKVGSSRIPCLIGEISPRKQFSAKRNRQKAPTMYVAHDLLPTAVPYCVPSHPSLQLWRGYHDMCLWLLLLSELLVQSSHNLPDAETIKRGMMPLCSQ